MTLLELIQEFFNGANFFRLLCELVTVEVLCHPHPRRHGKALHVLLLLLMVAASQVALYLLVDSDNASTALEAPICLVFTLLYLTLTRKADGCHIFYYASWAYFVAELATQTFVPLQAQSSLFNGGTALGFCLAQLYYILLSVGMGFVVYKLLLPGVTDSQTAAIPKRRLALHGLMMLLFTVLANYQVIYWLLGENNRINNNMITVYRWVVCTVCIFVLLLQNSLETLQRTEMELALSRQLWLLQKEQYELSQENIDLINRKCHDLKRQMEAIRQLKDEVEIDRQLEEMEHAVLIYDSAMKTGNRALDIVLTEKSLQCEGRHINMTCMADGSYLDFLDKIDLYTMFGNALDNAIEAVSKLEDKAQRVIQVAVYTEKALLMIRVRNYCQGKVSLENGLPATSKANKQDHGFGLKSIRSTAEKYGGDIAIQSTDHIFSLQILIPLPQEEPLEQAE
ncbi:MAG: GHKL domain-containing protein [Clostridiales bacterium]|nr:GHKL domain-containing protein [Clostridiales bacterium]